MTIGTLLGFILIGIGLQQHSANIAGLTSTCQNETTTEGETGQMHYSINPNIPIDDDPGVVIFIKRYQATGNIIRCRRPYNEQHVECKVSDHRFQSDGLIGSTISLRVPNATLILQGHYELHVVANGIFHPTTSCHLSVHNKTGFKPENGETVNVMTSVVPIVICLVCAGSVVVIVLFIRRIRHSKRRDCSSNASDQIKSTLGEDQVTSNAPPSRGSDYSGLEKTIPSAGVAPNMSEILISLKGEEGPNGKENKDDAEGKSEEGVPSCSADQDNSATEASDGVLASVGSVLLTTVSAAYSATVGKLTNLKTSENIDVNQAEHVASSVDQEQENGCVLTQNTNESNEAHPALTEDRNLNSKPSLDTKLENREDIIGEEPTETNGLLQKDQEPSATQPAKKKTKWKSLFGGTSNKSKSLNQESETEKETDVSLRLGQQAPATDSEKGETEKETDVSLRLGQQAPATDSEKGLEEIETVIEKGEECFEGMVADVTDENETKAFPLQETGESAAAGTPATDFVIPGVAVRLPYNIDTTSATEGFNTITKITNESKQRQQNDVASTRAGLSHPVKKDGHGMSASSLASSSRETPKKPIQRSFNCQGHTSLAKNTVV